MIFFPGKYKVYKKWGVLNVVIEEDKNGVFKIKTETYCSGKFITMFKNGKQFPDKILRITYSILTTRVFIKKKESTLDMESKN